MNNNFKQDILDAAGDETIEAFKVISTISHPYLLGEYANRSYDDRDTAALRDIVDKVISWEEAAPMMDYKYDTFGGFLDCHDVIFWTATRVFYIDVNFGFTSIESLPRHPK